MDANSRDVPSRSMPLLERGELPPVPDVEILFDYSHRVLGFACAGETDWAMDRLFDLAEAYAHEETFSQLCQDWALDCLLLDRRFERWWELTEPTDDRELKLRANLRANMAVQLREEPHPFDLIRLAPGTLTSYSRQHLGGYIDHLRAVLGDYEQRVGPLLETLLRVPSTGAWKRPVYLFRASPLGNRTPVELDHSFQDFSKDRAAVAAIREMARVAENRLRDQAKVPRVGQGWVAETALFEAVRTALPGTAVVQHGRPRWLGRQHLDIWIPRHRIAVEYHGAQHFHPVDFFGGQEAFEATIERDQRKADLCRANGVTLIVATEQDTTEQVIKRVRKARTSRSS